LSVLGLSNRCNLLHTMRAVQQAQSPLYLLHTETQYLQYLQGCAWFSVANEIAMMCNASKHLPRYLSVPRPAASNASVHTPVATPNAFSQGQRRASGASVDGRRKQCWQGRFSHLHTHPASRSHVRLPKTSHSGTLLATLTPLSTKVTCAHGPDVTMHPCSRLPLAALYAFRKHATVRYR
jgi:hypothetical protein